MPKTTPLDDNAIAEIRKLTCREAKAKFRISQATWKRITTTKDFLATRARTHQAAQAIENLVTESVKAFPHLNTKTRADRLGIRCESCHRILARLQLSRLEQRLRFAGYQVEVVKPLQVARLRRIVACRPGSIIHIDYKTFGFLRGPQGEGKRLGGYVVVDGFTGWIAVHLTTTPTAANAIAAVEKFCAATPFPVRGVMFSDNGIADFTQPKFVEWCLKSGFIQRTTRLNHPWSNGKVEAVNRTLKYQCFPALVTADAKDWKAVANAVDAWVEWYNRTRSHTGHINRGLPPNALYELWKSTSGDHFQRLVALGIIRPDSEWQVRRMGSAQAGRFADEQGVPFAIVLERDGRPEFAQAAVQLGRHVEVRKVRPQEITNQSNLILAR